MNKPKNIPVEIIEKLDADEHELRALRLDMPDYQNPVGNEPIDSPTAPPKHSRKPKDKGNVAGSQEAPSRRKSHLKIAKEMEAEEAPAPDILNRVPSPFDPALLRIDPRNSSAHVTREIINITIRKPSRYEPFRTHPTLRIDVKLCQPKKGAHEGEAYLVSPCMQQLLAKHTTDATLFFLMTEQGAPLVTAVPLPGVGEREHTAHSSFRHIAADAEKEWCLAIYNRPTNSYEKGTTGTQFADPVWPDLTLTQILEKTFRDYYIQDRTHPFCKSIGL